MNKYGNNYSGKKKYKLQVNNYSINVLSSGIPTKMTQNYKNIRI